MLETQTTGAHAFLATLKANGIEMLFGLPGSTEAPLLEALRADARDSLRADAARNDHGRDGRRLRARRQSRRRRRLAHDASAR